MRDAHSLARPPAELLAQPLVRLGEGIGKVVYASPHWVVKRARSDTEIIALIVLWRLLRRWQRFLPSNVSRFFQRPSRRIRLLRVFTQFIVILVPDRIWFSTHIGTVWKRYREQDRRGEQLARDVLLDTELMPASVAFPCTQVRVKGWPFRLNIDHATERVDCTFPQCLERLSAQERFTEIELWLDRFLALRQQGWQHGLFSTDAHLKNFGVIGDRVVLLDAGGLTDQWREVETTLAGPSPVEPHIALGLGPILESTPDIAARFNAKWKQTVCVKGVRRQWRAFRRPATAAEGV